MPPDTTSKPPTKSNKKSAHSKAKGKVSITNASDLKDIHLEGEESESVPIWATYDDIRREITAYLNKSGSSKVPLHRR